MPNVTSLSFALRGTPSKLAWASWLRSKLLQPRAITVTLAAAAALSCASYVWLASGSAGVNLQVRQLRDRVAELQQRSSELQQRSTQLRSLSRVSEASARLGLEPMPSAQFTTAGPAVAAR